MRLSCLGWTQEEIGEVLGLTHGRVSQIVNKFDAEEINNSFASGKSVEEIAKYNDIDIQTLWHYILKDKDDIEKLEILSKTINGFDFGPKVYDVENYSACLPLTGSAIYDGRIPGQLVINLLCWHTKPGDLVIDPMAGGGTKYLKV